MEEPIAELQRPAVVLRFRSYIPKDEKLKEKCMKDDEDIPTSKKVLAEVATFFQEQVLKAEAEADSLLSLAPKKPNWDLKRDVEKKLAKLEKKTQRAIIELQRGLSTST
eukprot:TRINITY_DN3856_c0_g1_i1.p1 TRINITY_DN3856_c0_g1~~TRINITY_DN3856_c0_g1_i1.p1  ORF type:complete len:109 (+),score=27.40 TRINITY_DN3856_c0_g1_i1:71-397(+)